MKRLQLSIFLLLSLMIVGTVGFRVCSGADWLDCLYMAVITMTTVGYEEAVPLEAGGRIFVILFLLASVGIFAFGAFQLGEAIFSLQMRRSWEKRRMQSRINSLNQHDIICGLGRMGQAMCRYLTEHHRSFVVVELAAENCSAVCEENNWPYIVGDATDDDVLKSAGIERATALASALRSDADNVYVAMSARLLNPKLQIISRASDERAVKKIERAGADRVISPITTAGTKMARMMLHPSIEDFIEIADDSGNELELADLSVSQESKYVDCRLADTDLSERGVMVIGIRRKSGERLMPPPGSAVIHEGDSLFVFGTSTAVNQMIGSVD